MHAYWHPSLEQVYLYSKIFVAAGSATVLIYKVGRWLLDIFQEVRNINENVQLLTLNHLPHIQTSLDEHNSSLLELKSDVRDMDTKMTGFSHRLNDTKSGVDTLNESFLRHLESMQEVTITKKRKR
jgi:hypothetical protein